MPYAVLCYDDETVTSAWSGEKDRETMDRLAALETRLSDAGRLRPVARLLPTTSATTLREQIDRLYAALERMHPSPVVTLNRSIAVAKRRGPKAALDLIEPLAERLSGYLHFHGVRGSFLLDLERSDEARIAFNRAIALAGSVAEASHIRAHLDRLLKDAAAKDREKI